jgi:hypothetical protein
MAHCNESTMQNGYDLDNVSAFSATAYGSAFWVSQQGA